MTDGEHDPETEKDAQWALGEHAKVRKLEARITALREALDSVPCDDMCHTRGGHVESHGEGCPHRYAQEAIRADDEAANG